MAQPSSCSCAAGPRVSTARNPRPQHLAPTPLARGSQACLCDTPSSSKVELAVLLLFMSPHPPGLPQGYLAWRSKVIAAGTSVAGSTSCFRVRKGRPWSLQISIPRQCSPLGSSRPLPWSSIRVWGQDPLQDWRQERDGGGGVGVHSPSSLSPGQAASSVEGCCSPPAVALRHSSLLPGWAAASSISVDLGLEDPRVLPHRPGHSGFPAHCPAVEGRAFSKSP